jgi:hypothetical protein
MSRRLLVRLYAVARLRGLVLWLLGRLEGDEFRSPTLRRYWACRPQTLLPPSTRHQPPQMHEYEDGSP